MPFHFYESIEVEAAMSAFFDDNTIEPNAPVNTPESNILNQLNELSARLARLTVVVEQHRIALQTAELNLATRIADIDDEQRRSLNQLTKKQETNEAHFKRSRIILISVFAVLALVISAALATFYIQLTRAQQHFNDDIAELRDMSNTLQHQPPDNVIQNQVIQERLQQLSEAVATLSSSSSVNVATPAHLESALESKAVAIPPAAPEVVSELQVGTVGQLRVDSAQPVNPPVAHSSSTAAASTAAHTSSHSTNPSINPASTKQIPVNDQLYSLQIIGFFSFEELLAYTQRIRLPEKVYFQTETYHGRPWFVLIHSLHSNYASAKAEIANFPPELAQLDVWIRKLPPDATVNLLDVTPAAQ
jgi:DamX protein